MATAALAGKDELDGVSAVIVDFSKVKRLAWGRPAIPPPRRCASPFGGCRGRNEAE